MELPKRARVSDLTNRELILLDFMFETPAPRPMLEDDVFPIHHNTTYSHGFNTQELSNVLNRFVNQGLIFAEGVIYRGKQTQSFGLTATGGKLWEAERSPIWKRFVGDCQVMSKQEGKWETKVHSYSEGALAACIKYYIETGFLGKPISKLEYMQTTSYAFIYWKEKSTVYGCHYLAKDNRETEEVDWDEYEQSRTWWRNVRELQKKFV